MKKRWTAAQIHANNRAAFVPRIRGNDWSPFKVPSETKKGLTGATSSSYSAGIRSSIMAIQKVGRGKFPKG
jgi:hypothetical protein